MATPVALSLQQLARALGGEVSGNGVLCPGPGHSAIDRSLSVTLKADAPDGFLVHSFVGDDPIVCRDHVRSKAGLEPFKPNGGGRRRRASEATINALLAGATLSAESEPAKGHVVDTYPYPDEKGELLYQVLRYEPKGFSQRRPNGNGGWTSQLGDVRRVPYRLPELIAYPDASVALCEGEKDSNRVASLGLAFCATTLSGGTKWTDDIVKLFADREVFIIQDADEAGRKKALAAAQALHGTAKSVRIVALPGLTGEPGNKDVSDWLDADTRNAEKLEGVCGDAPLWAPSAKDEKPAPEASQPMPWIDMSSWDHDPVPEQEWSVLNRVPKYECCLFTGEGAAGKSTIELHRSAAHVLARDWLGTMPEPGPAFHIDAEDNEKALHIRLAAITQHYGVKFADLIKGGLHLMSLAGQDAVLATVSRSGKVEPTTLYRQLLEAAGDIKPKSISIASCANVFTGDENNRSQVQQFVSLITRIPIIAGGCLVLVAHPSLTGINTDTGLSGTTQWHNGPRARFYMKGIKPDSGEQPDDDLREIVFKKNNYGPKAESIALRWQNGLFLPMPGMGSLDTVAREAKSEEIFVALVRRFSSANRNLSDKPGLAYAPALFAHEDEAKQAGVSSKNLEAAMRRLFKLEVIWNEPYGKPSRPHHRIALKT
jgi:RecA-family ATPase